VRAAVWRLYGSASDVLCITKNLLEWLSCLLHFDDERALKATRKEKRELTWKQKEAQALSGGRPTKRAALPSADGSPAPTMADPALEHHHIAINENFVVN